LLFARGCLEASFRFAVAYFGRSSQRVDKELGEAEIHRIALGYLNRFDASVAVLRKVLVDRVERALKRAELEAPEVERRKAASHETIEQLIARFQESGLLDDRRYASNMVASLRRRGVSARAIQSRLSAKGVSGPLIQTALSQASADPHARGTELDAATAYARRRKLGHFRGTTDRKQLHKDLAAMARAGFDYETAVRTLAQKLDDDGDF
jgi:regulatory protein